MERWFIPAQQCDEQTMAPYNFKIFAEHKLGQRFNGDKAKPRICRNRRVPVSEIKVRRRSVLACCCFVIMCILKSWELSTNSTPKGAKNKLIDESVFFANLSVLALKIEFLKTTPWTRRPRLDLNLCIWYEHLSFSNLTMWQRNVGSWIAHVMRPWNAGGAFILVRISA